MMICDVCKSKNNHIKKVTCKYKVKDKTVEFESERRICDDCGNIVYDDKLETIISKRAIEKYNSIYGIDKDKIINLRKSIGLSQESFSKIIGCAKKTLISYEKSSAIPNDIYLVVLKMITSDPETLLFLIKYNEDRFSKEEYLKYTTKITKYISNNKQNFQDDLSFSPSIYNGFTKTNYAKIKNIILYLCKTGLYKTKLLKELFYCDFLNYKVSGCSITGLEYARLPFGSVPDDYENIIYSLLKDKDLKCLTEVVNNVEKNTLKSNQKPNLTLFSKEELKVINEVIEKFKDYTVSEIEEYSHKEKAWELTKTGKLISYEYAFDIDFS